MGICPTRPAAPHLPPPALPQLDSFQGKQRAYAPLGQLQQVTPYLEPWATATILGDPVLGSLGYNRNTRCDPVYGTLGYSHNTR